MYLELDDYKLRIETYTITDCAVHRKDTFYFSSKEKYDTAYSAPFDSELKTRLHRLILHENKGMWRTFGASGFSDMYIEYSARDQMAIGVDMGGSVFKCTEPGAGGKADERLEKKFNTLPKGHVEAQ